MSIIVRDVGKSFGDFAALTDVCVEIPTGSLTALLGPSGGGKSTLLRVIAGLEKPDTGSVEIEGRDATRLPAQDRGVGFVFQHYAAFKHLTVERNVAFGLEIRKRPKPEIKEKVRELLELVHLEPVRAPLPGAALGWPAAAHGAGPRPRGGAAGAAPRRAVRRARRPGPQGAARLAAAAARPGARHDGVRDARPGGGDGGRRLDRRDRGRARSSRSARRTTSTTRRPTTSS